MKTKLLFLLSLIFCLSCAQAGETYECPLEDTNSWSHWHWTSSTTAINIIDNTDGSTYNVEQVVESWNDLNIPFTLVYSHWSDNIDYNGAPRVDVYEQFGNGWLGLARVLTFDGTHIHKAEVFINPLMILDEKYNDDAIKHVMCQEIGHTLGLDHIIFETCMDDCQWASTSEHWIECIKDQRRTLPHKQDACQLNALIHDDSDEVTPFLSESVHTFDWFQ